MSDGPQGESGRLPLVLIISPSSGRLKILPPKKFRHGREWVDKGQPVAMIDHGAGKVPDEVPAPYKGYMGGLMGRDGEPIREGQPVAWMEGIPDTKEAREG